MGEGFLFFESNAIPEISDFTMCSNQLVINEPTKKQKMAANDGQLKPTIRDVHMIFHCKYWKWNKNF